MRGLIIDYLTDNTTNKLSEMQQMTDRELFELYNETRDVIQKYAPHIAETSRYEFGDSDDLGFT